MRCFIKKCSANIKKIYCGDDFYPGHIGMVLYFCYGSSTISRAIYHDHSLDPV